MARAVNEIAGRLRGIILSVLCLIGCLICYGMTTQQLIGALDERSAKRNMDLFEERQERRHRRQKERRLRSGYG